MGCVVFFGWISRILSCRWFWRDVCCRSCDRFVDVDGVGWDVSEKVGLGVGGEMPVKALGVPAVCRCGVCVGLDRASGVDNGAHNLLKRETRESVYSLVVVSTSIYVHIRHCNVICSVRSATFSTHF